MTFSLRPISGSILPLTAASVRTRVVSWKEAAEKKERVCSEALVMPSSTGVPVAGLPPFSIALAFASSSSSLIDLLAFEEAGVARIDDVDLLQHLTHDHFDVLVVDVDALQPVDLLDLVDEVSRKLLHALDRQNVVRRRIAVDDVIALLDDVAVLKVNVLALRDQIFDRLAAVLLRDDGEALLVLIVLAELHRRRRFPR